jgi:hypothetical protein
VREFDEKRLLIRIDSIESSMKRIAAALEKIAVWMTESDGVVARRYPGNEIVTALYRGDVPYGDVEVVDCHLEASGDDTEEDDRK